MLNWENHKWGFFPRIENADIGESHQPTPERIALWVNAGIHVQGRPEWIFIKVHTRSTQEHNMETLLGGPANTMFSELENNYNDGENYILHYTSTQEMYNIINAAEEGKTGNPSSYRNYLLPTPENCPGSS